nr:HAMP domain-containing sensor histidine kinase [Alteromonas sp. 5E99-2]
MLRHAAHELKTPLASIKEGCSLLSDEVLGELNPRQNEVVTLLHTSSVRLESLVAQLLDYTVLLQQTEPNLEAIDLSVFLEHFLTDNKLALQQNGHTVEVKMDIDTVHADEVLLRRIFDNVLSNAIAYGDTSDAIVINIYKEGEDQVIDISNAGTTIPAQDRELLFKPFHRGQEIRHDRVSGSGLGLSIVSECAALMLGNARFIDSDFADICIRVKIPVT